MILGLELTLAPGAQLEIVASVLGLERALQVGGAEESAVQRAHVVRIELERVGVVALGQLELTLCVLDLDNIHSFVRFLSFFSKTKRNELKKKRRKYVGVALMVDVIVRIHEYELLEAEGGLDELGLVEIGLAEL